MAWFGENVKHLVIWEKIRSYVIKKKISWGSTRFFAFCQVRHDHESKKILSSFTPCSGRFCFGYAISKTLFTTCNRRCFSAVICGSKPLAPARIDSVRPFLPPRYQSRRSVSAFHAPHAVPAIM